MPRSLIKDLKKGTPQEIVGGLTSADGDTAISTARRLIADAQEYSISIKEYLTASIIVTDEMQARGIETGYEAALEYLKLPVRDDLRRGMSIQMAQDTFATQPGTRILFPEVIMDMIQWKQGPQDQIISVDPMISQVRTVSGTNELIWTQLDEDDKDLGMNSIAETGQIPIVDIKYSTLSVKFYKVGKGYRLSYEFQRRASIDVLTPFVNRMNREFEIQRVQHATNVLVNGDNVAAAVTVDAETSFGGTNGSLDYRSFLKWLVSRMKAGYPIDTLVMNYDVYGEFLTLFEPTTGSANNMETVGARAGVSFGNTVLENIRINMALSPNMTASTFLGLIKGETLEELREAGSEIVESERIIRSQQVMFVRTANIGYNLITPDARRGFSFAS